jgi:uncharacterized protein (TIGR03067 family)
VSDSLRNEVVGRLHGAWRVVSLTIAGEVVPRETYDDGEDFAHYFWFADGVITTGDRWAAWEMPFTMKVDRQPMEIDITRDDLPNSWLQQCIFEIRGDTLRICGAGSVDKPRPSQFTSTGANDQMLYVAERCDEPLPE